MHILHYAFLKLRIVMRWQTHRFLAEMRTLMCTKVQTTIHYFLNPYQIDRLDISITRYTTLFPVLSYGNPVKAPQCKVGDLLLEFDLPDTSIEIKMNISFRLSPEGHELAVDERIHAVLEVPYELERLPLRSHFKLLVRNDFFSNSRWVTYALSFYCARPFQKYKPAL